MRNMIIGFMGIIIILLTGVTINTVSGKSMRQNELDSTVTEAMESSMRALSTADAMDEKEFVADFIQGVLVKMNSDSRYKITIYTLDTEKGLLDAEVTQEYTKLNRPGKATVRRVVLMDDYENLDNTFYSVTFKENGTPVKQVRVHAGDRLTEKMLPMSDVSEWEFDGHTYTESNIDTLAVMSDMEFVSVE